MNRLALRDPVDGTTFRAIECAAPLLCALSLQHQTTIKEIYIMVRVALFGLNGADEDWDPFLEIEQKIEEARQDRVRLRKMREQGGSLDEVVEIMQRNRSRLEELMEIDPSRAEEIRSFLEGSEQRVREMWCARKVN